MQYREYFAGDVSVPGVIVCPKMVNPDTGSDVTSGSISQDLVSLTHDLLEIPLNTELRAAASLTFKCTSAFTALGDDISASAMQQTYFITWNQKTSTYAAELLAETRYGTPGVTASIVFTATSAIVRLVSTTTPWKISCVYDYQVCPFA